MASDGIKGQMKMFQRMIKRETHSTKEGKTKLN